MNTSINTKFQISNSKQNPKLQIAKIEKFFAWSLNFVIFLVLGIWCLGFTGCTVKAVGDPNRPITINANVVVDIRGLKQTASNIEDMIAEGGQK